MYIVFHGKTLSLLSLFALQIYLNIEKELNFKEIKNLVLTEKVKVSPEKGRLNYIQNDKLDNQIFLLLRGKEKKIVCQALMGFTRIFSSKEKIVFFDLSFFEKAYLTLAFLLKKIRFNKLGQKLVLRAIKKKYNHLLTQVCHFKK